MRSLHRKTLAAATLATIVIAGCSSSHAASTTTTTTTTKAPSTTTTIEATTTSTAPTTTTVARALQPADAVSASFVSPDQGFVLARNGLVYATSDGGRRWHTVGSLEVPSLGLKIRFIDAADGFAFAPESSVLRITHDGGATWTDVDRPFRTIQDLAIWRGTVYAVADPALGNGFGIWSTPVAHLVWKRDPLAIPVGAGPVPYQQLVFAGDRGWILNVDRLVGTGARLDPGSTQWKQWAPICQGVGGPAELTASTGNDLVAVCSPGVASTSETSFIEFSHDGGNTFTRIALHGTRSGVGGPLSPNADTAIILNGSMLQRTTDGGATWHMVASLDPDDGGASDFGFTTATQGFLAFPYGQMLMTRDGGATWKPVTLP